MAATALSQPSIELSSETAFIVDDDGDMREALTLLIRAERLNTEAYSSASEFLKAYDPNRAGCLLLDVCMPGMSGLELQRQLNPDDLWPPIIFITAYAEVALASQALRSGAVDYLQKPFSSIALLERIHEALARDKENRRRHALKRNVQERISHLTQREREIMGMLGAGIGTKRIAQTLLICPKTVDNHRASILEKMNVENPAQLGHLLTQAQISASPSIG